MVTDMKVFQGNRARIWRQFEQFLPMLSKISGYNEDEISRLILSAIRTEEDDIITKKKMDRKPTYFLDIPKIENWLEKKVVPNTVLINTDDPDLLKLLVFSLAMPYKISKGEIKSTDRIANKYFNRVFSDTFIGKIGEIAFKKYAEQKLGVEIEPDWAIGRDISTFQSDITGSVKTVSIKSTDTLESIWAEAPQPADYGIFIKVALPKDFFMKILAHVSSLRKLLRFVEEHLEKDDSVNDLLKFVEETAYGKEMTIKAYVCGFFEASPATLKHKGEELSYLGEVHEDKHLLECNKLKYSPKDWEDLFSIILL
ncbi:MAG TPA: hypothetical protein VGA85_05630 [Dehalococcoidales bacterium]